MSDQRNATSDEKPLAITTLRVSLGVASRLVIADCIRKWTAGGELTARERQIVDEALVCNRIEMLGAVFADRETDHVR
ncbi:hypothetical protein [Rhizobium leguminosarum]|uniref:hypothetical protein n=1 Tax=Rhizobium leguminosarum TaxID=384 RepID=UPI002F933136